MSGHSKWAKIKHQKGANDAKKGVLFTKLAKNITLVAKDGGGDINMNFALRLAVNKAKEVNMPADNIERAIKKAVGGDDKLILQNTSYEAMYGNSGLIIDCSTDNLNRTVAEVKKIAESHGAKMVSIGSISWNFSELGMISVRPQIIIKSEKFGVGDTYKDINIDDLELELMDLSEVENIEKSNGEDDDGEFELLEVFVAKNDLKETAIKIEKMGYRVTSFELVKIAADKVDLNEEEKEKLNNVIEAIEEYDDVDSVWTNAV